MPLPLPQTVSSSSLGLRVGTYPFVHQNLTSVGKWWEENLCLPWVIQYMCPWKNTCFRHQINVSLKLLADSLESIKIILITEFQVWPGSQVTEQCLVVQPRGLDSTWESLPWGKAFRTSLCTAKPPYCALKVGREFRCSLNYRMEFFVKQYFLFIEHILHARHCIQCLIKIIYLLNIIIKIFNENQKKNYSYNHINDIHKIFYLLTVMFNGSKLSGSM